MDISLIVTTYNWPEALRLTLHTVCRQSMRPDQVIVADDGSGPETARAVKDVLGPSDLTWCHVRHGDKGVRQSRIKNLAVRYSQAQYLILIDHDVALHKDFIADHIVNAEADVFLQGKRVLLSEQYTKAVIQNGRFTPPKFWTKGLGNRKNTLRFPLISSLLNRPKNFETSLRGCNLSMFRHDFLKVDGFDEIFDRSWGREDSDICYRLFHNGIKIKTIWFAAIQYHLKHDVFTKWDKERLDLELNQNVDEKRIRAVHGFSKLSSEGEIVEASKDF
jgi:GT2 family glycosyltransferase